MKKVYLLDVSSLFFRAYYAIRPLSAPDGTPVNAIYGFVSMLIKLLKEARPQYVAVCYDLKEPSFRRDLYAEYKANRSEMPDDLAAQIPFMKKVITDLGLPCFEKETFEADDVIGSIACWAQKNGMETVIVSGDKDFAQLVSPKVIMWDTMKDVRYDIPTVIEKWGIRPDQMIDYLSLIGDASDNIPGIPGVGPKTAQKLLTEFDTVENAYKNIDTVKPPSLKEKMITHKKMQELSKDLVTIRQDIDLDLSLKNLEIKPWNTNDLRELFERLNFKSFLKVLLEESPQHMGQNAAAEATKKAETKSEAGVSSNLGSDTPLIRKILPPKESSDQTNNADPGITSFDLSNTPVRVAGVSYNETVERVTIEDLPRLLKPTDKVWMRNENNQLSFYKDHTYIFDGEAIEFFQWTVKNKVPWYGFDLKKMWHQIINEAPSLMFDKSEIKKADLPMIGEDAALLYYVFRSKEVKDWLSVYEDYFQRPWPLNSTPGLYFSELQNLFNGVWEKIKDEPLGKIYSEVEKPVAIILLSMEILGIKIDLSFLKEFSEELRSDIAKTEIKIFELAGEKFNVGSPKQLGNILFEKMKLPPGKKTKTGFSTDNEFLESSGHPIAKQVLEWRELSKLKSTYVDALPELADSQGRVHTTFNQLLTATGRLSSNNPNLQNIPIRTPRGQRVRKAFVASEGKQLLSVDYSQIELRILAHITKDPGLTKAFKEDLDIHTATAAEVFGIPLDKVTSEHRRKAKAVNFGIAYGQGAFGLAEVLGIPRGEAQNIIKEYFRKFQGVQDFIQNTITEAEKTGFVETLFGRRRYVPEIQGRNGMLKKAGERAAINAPIQGTASDLVKKAMEQVFKEIQLPLLLQVHDELIFEATEAEIKKEVPRLVEIMENIVKLDIPLKVNWKTGKNWDEAH